MRGRRQLPSALPRSEHAFVRHVHATMAVSVWMGVLMASILEATMLLCFGLSWPINALNAWRARTAKATSPAFLALITFGYVAGIAA